jgi:hypothetical protein
MTISREKDASTLDLRGAAIKEVEPPAGGLPRNDGEPAVAKSTPDDFLHIAKPYPRVQPYTLAWGFATCHFRSSLNAACS